MAEKMYTETEVDRMLRAVEIGTIEKACDVYAGELTEIINILNKVGEMRGIDKLGEILHFEGCVKDFRKKIER